MIRLAIDLDPARVIAALVAVRDRAALTLGEVTTQAILYSIAARTPPFDATAERLIARDGRAVLVAACAVVPPTRSADLLIALIDVLDRITGGVMAEPLLEAASPFLAQALEAPTQAGTREGGALAGSLM